ncbi:MAG TPA: Ig-like domain-containing protein [Candidatus Krumholzibacteria bacterium]|nr:Ig-like domain-containing protein [Candidatus Krumholzibacteria bacterium]
MSIPKVLFLTLLLAVAGCDDDDDNGISGPDTTPPVISDVDVIDESHIEVRFNEDVDRGGAEDAGNYMIIETVTPRGEPVDTLTVTGVALQSDDRTVSITTSAMNEAPHEIIVTGVQDDEGNGIETPVIAVFTGTDNPDTSPPELLFSNPANNAINVITNPLIELTFSEPILLSSLLDGTTLSSTLGEVEFTAETDDSVHVTITPTTVLERDTRYTLEFEGVQDPLGNVMSTQSISFTTTDQLE